MENNIESPEFWEQVKYQFSRSGENYLCEASSTFRSKWTQDEETQRHIRKYGREFLSSHKEWGYVFKQTPQSLFFHDLYGERMFLHYRAVRLEFLNYMIQKTKNNAE